MDSASELPNETRSGNKHILATSKLIKVKQCFRIFLELHSP